MYLAFALIAMAFLVWLWWQQRIRPKGSSTSAPTNTASVAVPNVRQLSKPTITTNPGIVSPYKISAPTTSRLTNISEVRLGNAQPILQVQTSNVTPPVSSTAGILSGTNARPEFDNSVRLPKDVLEVQIALERQGISSGCIDGKVGPQTRAAVRAFQTREHLSNSGEADSETKALLQVIEQPLTSYSVTSNDLARLTPVPQTWLEKSLQERLDYETILELVSEKSHAHPGLIRSLNRGIDWTNVAVGTVVTILNVRYPSASTKAAFIRIRLAEKTLEAFDVGTNLLAHFPCSIAQRVEKRPVGQLLVEKLAPNPNYRFDPEVFAESAEARELGRVLMIPPGPNNPVGSAWIGLNRPGYGIHGTPHPEEVGRTESHGCFRLANWNADYLLQLVSVGTPVLVEP